MERKRKDELQEKYEAIFSGGDDQHKCLRGAHGSSSSNISENDDDIGIYK